MRTVFPSQSRSSYRNSLLTLSILLFGLSAVLVAQAAVAAVPHGESHGSVRPHSALKTAPDALELRTLRRVGVGLSGAGPLGLGGINLELNFARDAGFVGGFGGGPGFQAFTLQYKRILSGESFLPYFAAGYSRWYSVGMPTPIAGGSAPFYLMDRFLSDSDKASGIYALNLVYPALGLQYLQSSGPWAGSSVFFEVLALVNLGNLAVAPTGTLGFLYYF